MPEQTGLGTQGPSTAVHSPSPHTTLSSPHSPPESRGPRDSGEAEPLTCQLTAPLGPALPTIQLHPLEGEFQASLLCGHRAALPCRLGACYPQCWLSGPTHTAHQLQLGTGWPERHC